jgi:hypothetical protein
MTQLNGTEEASGPEPSKVLVDEIMVWPGFGNGVGRWESKCRMRVFEYDGRQIAVASELEDNEGTSVTNAAEYIATLAIGQYGLDMRRLLWVEHYPARLLHKNKFGPDDMVPESFDIVYFDTIAKPSRLDPKKVDVRFVKPSWKRLKPVEINSLVGQEIAAA